MCLPAMILAAVLMDSSTPSPVPPSPGPYAGDEKRVVKSLSEGEIAGKNVTRLKPGDEVFGSGSGTFAKFARAPGALPAPLQTLDRRLASSPRHRARIELLA